MAMSGYQKAAIFLSAMGEETAAEILKCLDLKEVEQITKHLTSLRVIDKEVVGNVMHEVSRNISKGDIRLGGKEFAKKVLLKGLGEDHAKKILEMTSTEDPLDSLKWIDSKSLSNFLVGEHPQTIALVLSMLEPQKAAEALSVLPDDLKGDVAFRIAKTENITDYALEELKEVIKGQLEMTKGKGKKVGGAKTVAEILNNCDRSIEQVVLDGLEEKEGTVADSVRQLMFIFDDLIKVDDRGIQAILKEVSTDDLVLALKTASDELKETIFRNMSKRASQILKEEMETKGPVKVSEVESAQQSIVSVARKLEEEGRIVIAGKGGEDIVV